MPIAKVSSYTCLTAHPPFQIECLTGISDLHGYNWIPLHSTHLRADFLCLQTSQLGGCEQDPLSCLSQKLRSHPYVTFANPPSVPQPICQQILWIYLQSTSNLYFSISPATLLQDTLTSSLKDSSSVHLDFLLSQYIFLPKGTFKTLNYFNFPLCSFIAFRI